MANIEGATTITDILNNTADYIADDLVKNVKKYAFYQKTNLISASYPYAITVDDYSFYGCTNLNSANFPVATTIGNSAFAECTALTSIDLSAVETFGQAVFSGCSALQIVILRTEQLVQLPNASVFADTPIAEKTGMVYVPASLVETYRADSVWQNYTIESIDQLS